MEMVDSTVLNQASDDIEARRKAMTWQPIETAPRDGTEVLVWCSRNNEMYVCVYYKKADDDKAPSPWLYAVSDYYQTDPYHVVSNPTHWMPLPPPPGDDE